MSSDEEEEAYEVERILAEKVENGVTKYLVKWRGYADEECTWEPPAHFDTFEILDLWKMQKADGDVLEKEDLRRLQLKMDAFKTAQSTDEAISEYSSEGESNPEFEEPLQPPAKRIKLVHDPPPLSNKVRSTKTPIRNRKVGTERDEKCRSPISRKISDSKPGEVSTARAAHKSKQDTTTVAARSNLPYLNTGTTIASSTTKAGAPASGSTTPAITFHAPELSQRRRGPSSTSTKKDATGTTGKRFKNLRHLNNARKRQAEKSKHLASTSTPSPLMEQEEPPTQIAGQTLNERPNESWLFFSDEEKDSSKDPQVGDQRREPGSSRVSGQQIADVCRNDHQTEFARSDKLAELEQTQVASVSPQIQANSKSLRPEENIRRELQDAHTARQPAKAQSEVYDNEAAQSSEKLLNLTRTENGANEFGIHSRTVSGPDRGKTTGTEDSARAAMNREIIAKDAVPIVAKVPVPHTGTSFSQSAPLVVSTAVQTTLTAAAAITSSSNPPQPMVTIDTQLPQWQPWNGQTAAQIHLSREQVLKGGIVRTPGRTWIKGDLVVELYLDGHLAGGAKIQNQPWHFSLPIVRLKPKSEHTLPIHFYGIKYDDYQARSKQASWWAISAVGAVEAFPDCETQLSAMAMYLETYNLGACWWHPDPTVDLMLVLYSCRSQSWAGISTHQQTRSGEVRLNVAFRNKFKGSQFDPLQQQPSLSRQDIDRRVSEDRDVGMIDTRTDFRREPRSRRTSIVSNSSSRAYDDVMMSPSEQLAREIADYALNARGRRASNAVERTVRPLVSLKAVPTDARYEQEDVTTAITVSPRELPSPAMSTDPRTRPTASKREPLANRIAPSPVNHQTRIDTVAENTHTSVTNSPIEVDMNSYLDRPLEELNQRPGSSSSSEFRGNTRVLLVYKREDLRKAQEVQEWLAKQVNDGDQVQIQSVDTTLDDKHEAWKNFKSYVKNSTYVLICDVGCPIYRFDGLGKLLNQNVNVICWQIDLNSTAKKPLITTRLFPTGWAMAMTHDCFLMGPDDATYALKWLKKRIEKILPASVLMLPPLISSTIQEQALISSSPATKKLFLELAALIQELIALSETQPDGLGTLGFTVILPRWGDVYSNNVPVSNQLSAIEQKLRDKTMSDEFLKYFGAWAMRNLTKHRGFLGLTMDEKPKNNEHVRFRYLDEFANTDRDLARQASKREKEKERQRSRSRDTSASLDRDRDRARGQSQDRNANERPRAESRGGT